VWKGKGIPSSQKKIRLGLVRLNNYLLVTMKRTLYSGANKVFLGFIWSLLTWPINYTFLERFRIEDGKNKLKMLGPILQKTKHLKLF